MILNIENHTVKIDFEARTVEVSQVTPNMTETETLVQAVERVQQPTLDQWQPTEAEMVEMHREMNPTTRKVRALETQPREPCRSSCCGTLNRRERDGSCAGCRGLTTDERESYRWSNLSLLDAVEGEE